MEAFWDSLSAEKKRTFCSVSKKALFTRFVNKCLCVRCSNAVSAIAEVYRCRDMGCQYNEYTHESVFQMLSLVPLRVAPSGSDDVKISLTDPLTSPHKALADLESLMSENPALPDLCPLPSSSSKPVSSKGPGLACSFYSAEVNSEDISYYYSLLDDLQRSIVLALDEQDFADDLVDALASLRANSRQACAAVTRLARELRARPAGSSPLRHSDGATSLRIDYAPDETGRLRVVINPADGETVLKNAELRLAEARTHPRGTAWAPSSLQEVVDLLIDAASVAFRLQILSAYQDHFAGHYAFFAFCKGALLMMTKEVENAYLETQALAAQAALLADLEAEERQAGSPSSSAPAKKPSKAKKEKKKDKKAAPKPTAATVDVESQDEEEESRVPLLPPPSPASLPADEPEMEDGWEEVGRTKTRRASVSSQPAPSPSSSAPSAPLLADAEFPPLSAAPAPAPKDKKPQQKRAANPAPSPSPSNARGAKAVEQPTPGLPPRPPTNRPLNAPASSLSTPTRLSVPSDPPTPASSSYFVPSLWAWDPPAALSPSSSAPFNPFLSAPLAPLQHPVSALPSPLSLGASPLHRHTHSNPAIQTTGGGPFSLASLQAHGHAHSFSSAQQLQPGWTSRRSSFDSTASEPLMGLSLGLQGQLADLEPVGPLSLELTKASGAVNPAVVRSLLLDLEL